MKKMARKLAVVIYSMITKQEEFRKNSAENFEKNYQDQLFRKISRQARRLGYTLHELDPNF